MKGSAACSPIWKPSSPKPTQAQNPSPIPTLPELPLLARTTLLSSLSCASGPPRLDSTLRGSVNKAFASDIQRHTRPPGRSGSRLKLGLRLTKIPKKSGLLLCLCAVLCAFVVCILTAALTKDFCPSGVQAAGLCARPVPHVGIITSARSPSHRRHLPLTTYRPNTQKKQRSKNSDKIRKSP